MDRTVEILARRAAAIIENDYKEPVYGSSTYLLVMEDIPYLLDQLAERDKEIDRLSQFAMMRESEIGDRDREIAQLREARANDLKILADFYNGEWCDTKDVCRMLNISFEEGLSRFEFSRTAEWNAAPLNGQKITTKFRIKQMAEPPKEG